MNILVVSECFRNGGLETQIKTYYDNLPDNVNMIFAFGEYSGEVALSSNKIFTGFHFSHTDTIKSFCEDVDRLVAIIKQESIDVIHVHPFYSFFSAFFASQLTKTKLVYSYHGVSSMNFSKSVLGMALFYYAFESGAVGKVFSVSDTGVNAFEKIGYKNSVFMPNPIDLKKFPSAEVAANNKWAIISRINSDKVGEIKRLILNKDKYGFNEVDIYGSGNCVEELEEFIFSNGLKDNVKIKGYAHNVFDTVNGKYNGIIGIGRVILEAATMGMPAFLMGYNKLTGFVNYDIYEKIRKVNFSNVCLNDTNDNSVSQAEINSIKDKAIATYSISAILPKYVDGIENSNSIFLENICNMYSEICKFLENEDDAACTFYDNRMIYNLAYVYVGRFSLDMTIEAMFANTNLTYDMYDYNKLRLDIVDGRLDETNQKIAQIVAQKTRLKRFIKRFLGKK